MLCRRFSHFSYWLGTLSLIGFSGLASAQATPAPQPAATSANAPAATTGNTPFVTVDGTVLTLAEFDRTARETYREKFYHGKPPEAEVNQMLVEVGMQMIDKVLMDNEIGRRAVKPDLAYVDAEIAKYEKQYGRSPAWQQQREATLPRLRAHLEQKSKTGVLEKEIKAAAAPTDADVKAFYEANNDLFTEPGQNKLSVILLKVDPSSSNEVWEKRQAEADAIRAKLDQGEDFATLAKQHSGDPSAANGGDLGYMHQRMLNDTVEEHIAKLQPKEIGGPIRVLEGYLIVRLDDRKLPRVREFKDVAERARDLATREAGENAWKAFRAKLRDAAKIEYSADFQKLIDEAKKAPAAAPSPEKPAQHQH